MRRVFTMFAVCAVPIVVGCSHDNPRRTVPATNAGAGARSTLQGVAVNRKLGAFLGGPNLWVDLPDTHWPSAVVGKSVEVTGMVVERHDLPVFIEDPGKPSIAGMPVPPGTDLREASKRSVIEPVKWKAVGGGG